MGEIFNFECIGYNVNPRNVPNWTKTQLWLKPMNYTHLLRTVCSNGQDLCNTKSTRAKSTYNVSFIFTSANVLFFFISSSEKLHFIVLMLCEGVVHTYMNSQFETHITIAKHCFRLHKVDEILIRLKAAIRFRWTCFFFFYFLMLWEHLRNFVVIGNSPAMVNETKRDIHTHSFNSLCSVSYLVEQTTQVQVIKMYRQMTETNSIT